MEKDEINRLLDRYLDGSATGQERALLESWYNRDPQSYIHELSEKEIAEDLDKVERYLFEGQPKRSKLWLRIVAAAAMICVMGGVALYFYNGHDSNSIDHPVYANDVAPGKNGATLTLANGSKINLSDAQNGQLAKQSGVSISKTADGQLIYTVEQSEIGNNQYNTLSTDKGETYQMRLPDGSAVWLNAASSLRYPANFAAQNSRRVELVGEAYFEVAKDKLHPFVVITSKQEVEVLGTHFNINSYGDESGTKTTLLEGSVRVTPFANEGNVALEKGGLADKARAMILVPGQQAVNQGRVISVGEGDLNEALAWKNGSFVFTGQSIQAVMRQLERWYDIEVDFKGKVSEETFYGDISRYKNISQVLKMLETTKAVHFDIKGRRITVSGK